MGVCTFCPSLDQYGNSARGVAFARRFVQAYNFHNFDSLIYLGDPTTSDADKMQGSGSDGSRSDTETDDEDDAKATAASAQVQAKRDPRVAPGKQGNGSLLASATAGGDATGAPSRA